MVVVVWTVVVECLLFAVGGCLLLKCVCELLCAGERAEGGLFGAVRFNLVSAKSTLARSIHAFASFGAVFTSTSSFRSAST